MKATTCTRCPNKLHCLILCGEPRRLHRQFKFCFDWINRIFRYEQSVPAYDAVRHSGLRWRAAEPIILKNTYATFYYIKDVVKERWPEGESSILQDSYYIYSYTEDIIKERWPEGERALLAQKQVQYIYYYIDRIVKGRWPEAEDIIKTDAVIASKYAVYVLKERWAEAEKVIANDYAAMMIYDQAFKGVFTF